MKKHIIPFAGLIMAASVFMGSVMAAGERVLVQGEDFVAQGEGEVEVIEGRIDAIGNTFRMWDNSGHWVEWKFTIPTDGMYKMAIRYAAGANPPVRKIGIDGKVVPGFEAHEFQLTDGWCKEENQWCNYVLRTGGKDALLDIKAGATPFA